MILAGMATEPVATTQDPATLAAWEKDIETEIAEVGRLMEPLQKRLDAAREKLDLVRRLRHLVTGGEQPRSRQIGNDQLGEPLGDVEQQIQQILTKAGKPMHIGSIRDELIARGVPLPGRGDEANIILRLRRALTLFTRTGRGMYGLTSWNLQPVAPAARRRRVRRRRKGGSS